MRRIGWRVAMLLPSDTVPRKRIRSGVYRHRSACTQSMPGLVTDRQGFPKLHIDALMDLHGVAQQVGTQWLFGCLGSWQVRLARARRQQWRELLLP